MEIVNMHDAKTRLSKLVQRAAGGETILIARSGRPLARLAPLSEETVGEGRLGFLATPAPIPSDFDAMGADRIADEFDGR